MVKTRISLPTESERPTGNLGGGCNLRTLVLKVRGSFAGAQGRVGEWESVYRKCYGGLYRAKYKDPLSPIAIYAVTGLVLLC